MQGCEIAIIIALVFMVFSIVDITDYACFWQSNCVTIWHWAIVLAFKDTYLHRLKRLLQNLQKWVVILGWKEMY